jgi:hypothetical protein
LSNEQLIQRNDSCADSEAVGKKMHLIGNSSDEESFAEDDEEQNRTNRETVPANSTYSSRLVFKRRLLADSDSDSSPQRTAREDE